MVLCDRELMNADDVARSLLSLWDDKRGAILF
jgi:hypothetical protein